MKEKIRKLNESESFLAGILRDLILVTVVLVIFTTLSQIALGLWTPMVAIESVSMTPHIRIGDIVFVESIHRSEIITYEYGAKQGYTSFGDYGDVILYRPNGKEGITPVIHRAMYYVEKGDPMWEGGPAAPHAGYITKGDNPVTNPVYDQQGSISFHNPVKKEWIIGIARFHRIPLLGYPKVIFKSHLLKMLLTYEYLFAEFEEVEE